ncbi:S-adenosylmethionine:tRNA ribosyltransferase-isomerase [candidate division KSB1 bacterium]
MIIIPDIDISEYDYHLPDNRIAKFPLAERDKSKLLIFNEGRISEDHFSNIPGILPSGSLIVFNTTKVIQARMEFQKATGARIEIFCLEPAEDNQDFQLAFQKNSSVVWKCMVGNLKKWKSDTLCHRSIINNLAFEIKAVLKSRSDNICNILFEWTPQELTFADILEFYGKVPLPPYLNREAVHEDKERYQTIYAMKEGSVAAPTAGLHFTKETIHALKKRNILSSNITLHVGAGTFQPVVARSIALHNMHTEHISVSKSTIELIHSKASEPIIAVGTTTIRTLESLFWYGVKLKAGYDIDFSISQWDPYDEELNNNVTLPQSMDAILSRMNRKEMHDLRGKTQHMIAPGYQYKVADILVTNFHQPKSTLLLLVAAFIGSDWKKAYQFAMRNNFRFLSYGDSCLFYKKH